MCRNFGDCPFDSGTPKIDSDEKVIMDRACSAENCELYDKADKHCFIITTAVRADMLVTMLLDWRKQDQDRREQKLDEDSIRCEKAEQEFREDVEQAEKEKIECKDAETSNFDFQVEIQHVAQLVEELDDILGDAWVELDVQAWAGISKALPKLTSLQARLSGLHYSAKNIPILNQDIIAEAIELTRETIKELSKSERRPDRQAGRGAGKINMIRDKIQKMIRIQAAEVADEDLKNKKEEVKSIRSIPMGLTLVINSLGTLKSTLSYKDQHIVDKIVEVLKAMKSGMADFLLQHTKAMKFQPKSEAPTYESG